MKIPRINNLFNKEKKHRVFDGKLVYGLQKNNINYFIDVGANFGQTALEIMKWGYDGKIVSIEPVLECHNYISNLSKKYNNWTILERMAVGDYDGTTKINVSEASDLSSILNPTDLLHNSYSNAKKHHIENVNIFKIDSIDIFDDIKEKNIFLKIDAQGYDYKVLKGSNKLIKHLSGIMIEASLEPLYDNQETYFDIIQFLHELGMIPHMICERSFSRRTKQQLQVDLVYFRK
tara:strand:+ start:2523 stop:3221 length:699 start_codon:yes stop_codon:yes gene_type:complete